MHKGILVVLAVIAAIVAYTMGRGMSAGSNLEERQKYWEAEIPPVVPAGTGKDDLEAFIVTHGEQMRCYTNEKRQSVCAFEDRQSFGGSRSMPMRLSVVFAMKDGAVSSVQYDHGFVAQEMDQAPGR